jgi:23S rRNA (adenine2503-C2)-methyltransferase
MKESFYHLTPAMLQQRLMEVEAHALTSSLLYNQIHKKGNLGDRFDASCGQQVSRRVQDWLLETFDFSLPTADQIHESEDGTVKFLYSMADGSTVETVLLPFQGKYSLCVSSQVGCAMNCSFCFTGTQGLKRHLESHEIVGQFLMSRDWLKQNRPDGGKILNVVFMGQGEPLHNFDAVKVSCEILISQHGASLADHKITVSTSGYLPGLKRWQSEMPQVNLALSLHSAFEDKRSTLIPINVKYPLDEVMVYLDALPLDKKRFITYEYLLLDGFNDGEEDAEALAGLLKNRTALLNIIPFNPYPGAHYSRPSRAKVDQFFQWLVPHNIPMMVRKTKGDDILAACGQLKSKG